MKNNTLKLSANKERDNSEPCIWMQAGIVKKKYCNVDYECALCRYDRALNRIASQNQALKEKGQIPKGKRANIISWKERLKAEPQVRRPCIHSMKGKIEFRACTNEYRCGDCEFDQFFYDKHMVHAVISPIETMEFNGFRIPQGYYFHFGHMWAKLEEGSSVRVGMDEFAKKLFGPLNKVTAPLMGKRVKQGNPEISIERDDHHAKLLSPVSGIVTEINADLRDSGTSDTQDTFSDAWIMRVHADNLRENLQNLMINDESNGFLKEEVAILYEALEETGGPLAADGGVLAYDIFGNMPELGWEKLTKLFLNTLLVSIHYQSIK